jgi:hypothetical protein
MSAVSTFAAVFFESRWSLSCMGFRFSLPLFSWKTGNSALTLQLERLLLALVTFGRLSLCQVWHYDKNPVASGQSPGAVGIVGGLSLFHRDFSLLLLQFDL